MISCVQGDISWTGVYSVTSIPHFAPFTSVQMPDILPLLDTLHLHCFRNLTDIYELNKIAKPILPPPSWSRNLQLQFSDVFIDMSWPTNWSDFYWILLHTLNHTEIMIMNSFCLFLTSYKECLIFGATRLGFLVSWAYLVEIDKKWCPNYNRSRYPRQTRTSDCYQRTRLYRGRRLFIRWYMYGIYAFHTDTLNRTGNWIINLNYKFPIDSVQIGSACQPWTKVKINWLVTLCACTVSIKFQCSVVYRGRGIFEYLNIWHSIRWLDIRTASLRL